MNDRTSPDIVGAAVAGRETLHAPVDVIPRDAESGSVVGQRLKRVLSRYGALLLVVVLPTIITASYFYGIAAPQYESEARFIVRSTQPQESGTSGIGQALGLVGGLSDARAQSFSVNDYLSSHDAVAAIDQKLGLVSMFRRPEADGISRLWWKEPAPEDLLRYYQRQVNVTFDSDTGITTLRVHAFRPDDAARIASQMLTLGEERVNAFNERAVEDSVRVASAELVRAEADVVKSQRALTAFRLTHRDIDPQKTGTNQLLLVGSFEQSLAQARAQLTSMTGHIDPASPQYVALANRIAGLESQLSAQSARLTGATGAIASDIGDYEELQLKDDFASKHYSSVATTLETAREDALKQHLYVVRVVEPNVPVKSLYPRSTLIVLSVFFLMLTTYGVGWLLVAGMREHAA
jgi:capsular polysaccharide transport system permease protein